MNDNVTKKDPKPEPKKDYKKPDELGGVYFSSHIKIYDPNTQQVLVKKRGDV